MNKYAGLISLAFGIAKAVEEQLPDTPGKHKLDLGLGIGALAFQQEESIRSAWGKPEVFASALSGAIGVAVSALNAIGIFKKKAA